MTLICPTSNWSHNYTLIYVNRHVSCTLCACRRHTLVLEDVIFNKKNSIGRKTIQILGIFNHVWGWSYSDSGERSVYIAVSETFSEVHVIMHWSQKIGQVVMKSGSLSGINQSLCPNTKSYGCLSEVLIHFHFLLGFFCEWNHIFPNKKNQIPVRKLNL
jgi:hypothetical protein